MSSCTFSICASPVPSICFLLWSSFDLPLHFCLLRLFILSTFEELKVALSVMRKILCHSPSGLKPQSSLIFSSFCTTIRWRNLDRELTASATFFWLATGIIYRNDLMVPNARQNTLGHASWKEQRISDLKTSGGKLLFYGSNWYNTYTLESLLRK